MGHYTLDVHVDSLDAAKAGFEAFADHLSTHSDRATASPGEIGTSWTGGAATAIKAEMTGLGSTAKQFAPKFTEAAEAVGVFTTAVQACQDTITSLNTQYDTANQHAAQAQQAAQQNHDHAVSDLSWTDLQERADADTAMDVAAGSAASTLRSTLQAIEFGYDEAITTLRAAATTLGQSLRAATVVAVPDSTVTSYVGGGDTTSVVRALRMDAVNAMDDGLGLIALRHQQGLDLFASREEADAEAQRLIHCLDQGIDDGDLAPADLDLLSQYQRNSLFASAMMNRMGPTGVSQLPTRLTQALDLYTTNHPLMDADDAAAYQQFRTDAERLVTQIAATLTTASHDQGLDRDFARQLVDRAVDTHGSAYGLSVLLAKGGTFDPTFTTTVATGVYDAERNGDMSPFWGPKSDNGDGTHPQLFGSDDWADPMVGVCEMLSRDPATAQDFLLGSGAKDGDANRLHYLTANRSWNLSDDADAFGHMIEAATTQLRDHDGVGSPGYKSAQIASQFINDLPYGNGKGNDLTDMVGLSGADSFHIYDGLKDSIGVVLAAYINDVQRGFKAPNGGSGDVYQTDDPALAGTQAYGVDLNGERTHRLLESVMSDSSAFESINGASLLLAQQELAHTASLLNGSDPEVTPAEALNYWNSAIQNNSRLMGATLDAANLAEIADGAAKDSRVQSVVDLASAGVEAIPIPGGKAVEFAFGQAKDLVFGQDFSDHEGQSRIEANNAKQALEIQMHDLVASAAFEHRLYGDDTPIGKGAPVIGPEDTGYFLDPQGRVLQYSSMSVPQQQAYESWLLNEMPSEEKNNISTYIETGINDY